MECICESCGRQYKYVRNKGGTKKQCNSCLVNKRRFKIKRQIVEVLGGVCSHCGYNRCLSALDVHHEDPSIKGFTISGAHSRSWASIEKELQFCVLLCANCHRERHHDHERYGCLL